MDQTEIVKKITKAALIQRINRKVAHEACHMSVTRDQRCAQDVCKYYVIDSRNYITGGGDDLYELAREYGCIREHEVLAED